ncbi:MAG TPA: hypothetical protein ENF42_02850 [Candidatus Bathyarchaeota archaeon]|nr:hypothetical protein [Candidatus Bathyarchaeota archaeon]
MFRAEVEEAEALRKLIKAVSEITEEAPLILTPEKLELKALDYTKSAMIKFSLPSVYFSTFDCDKEITVGLNFKDINKAFRALRSGDRLEIQIPEDTSSITLILKGVTTRTMTFSTMEPPPIPQEPKEVFTADAKLISSEFEHAIKFLSSVSSEARFIAEEDKLSIAAKTETGSYTNTFSRGDPVLLELNVETRTESIYSLPLLGKMMVGCKISDIAGLKFAADKPLILDYPMIEGATLTYYLAPIVEKR